MPDINKVFTADELNYLYDVLVAHRELVLDEADEGIEGELEMVEDVIRKLVKYTHQP